MQKKKSESQRKKIIINDKNVFPKFPEKLQEITNLVKLKRIFLEKDEVDNVNHATQR